MSRAGSRALTPISMWGSLRHPKFLLCQQVYRHDLQRWILPPGVVDGGPSQDDADAGVGAVQVEHGQSLLVRGPSDEEYNNVLRPGIKAQITEWFGLKGPKSSSHSQQDTLPCPAWPWTLSGMEQPQILSWDQTKPRINPAPRRQ